MRVIVFGTGKRYKNRRDRLKYDDVVAVVDNDISKQGQFIDGHIIE